MNQTRLLTVLLFCGFLSLNCQSADAGSLNDLALGNVIYLNFQGLQSEAYSRALYYEQRNLDEKQKFQLAVTRAGLALDLGLDQLAQTVLTRISETELEGLDRQALHFQLARDAYRRHQWLRFESELTGLNLNSQQLKSSQGIFLQAELARLNGDFTKASTWLDQLTNNNILRYYSGFNLGITAYAAGDYATAKVMLTQLADGPKKTLEQLLISERSRIVLANIDIKEGQFDSARQWLTGITATGQYGPSAFATLAHLSMQNEDYTQAADLWFYLIEHTPWHPAVADAHVGLPYTLEQVRGTEQAYLNYQHSAQRLTERRSTLQLLLLTLDESDVAEFANLLLLPVQDNAAQLNRLDASLGHSDWANWLASEYSLRLAKTWRRVSDALNQLAASKEALAVLLVVDAEQQLRQRNAAAWVQEKHTVAKLDSVDQQVDLLNQALLGLTDDNSDAGLWVLATADEINTLQQLQSLKERAIAFNAGLETRSRINKLYGVVQYRILDDIPVRVRKRQVRLEQMQRQVTVSQNRVSRIQQSAVALASTDSVGSRITALSGRTDQMLVASREILARTGDALLAQVGRGIQVELTGIKQQLVYVHLAMARLGDTHLAGRRQR